MSSASKPTVSRSFKRPYGVAKYVSVWRRSPQISAPRERARRIASFSSISRALNSRFRTLHPAEPLPDHFLAIFRSVRAGIDPDDARVVVLEPGSLVAGEAPRRGFGQGLYFVQAETAVKKSTHFFV